MCIAHTHVALTISSGTREVLFICGEIDCREGIPRAMAKKIYATLEQAVKETVKLYVQGLQALHEQYGLQFWIHPVTPPINPKCTGKYAAIIR